MNPLTDEPMNITTDRYETDLQYTAKNKNNSELNFSLAYVNHKRKPHSIRFLATTWIHTMTKYPT
jgi:hypothetical protein